MCTADRFNRPTEFEPDAAPPKNFDRPIKSAASGAAKNDPTRETYLSWSDAYDFFNTTLFGGELPPCLITYQRSRKFYGYFSADRFVPADLKSSLNSSTACIDEIAISPTYLREELTEHALSTLVHEMAHLKRYRLIEPRPSPSYHDKKWADIMTDIGLIPSTTGEPGGKTTGQKVGHYVIVGGRFNLAAQELMRRGFTIRYVEHEQSLAAPPGGAEAGKDDHNDLTLRRGQALRRARSKASKTPFSCMNCKPVQTAWAKPSAHFICGDCNTPMLPQPSPTGV